MSSTKVLVGKSLAGVDIKRIARILEAQESKNLKCYRYTTKVV